MSRHTHQCDQGGWRHPPSNLGPGWRRHRGGAAASSLNNLAAFYRRQKRFEEAEPLYKRGLEIREKTLGAEHHRVAVSLNSLAILYTDQQRFADSLAARADAIRAAPE